MIDKHTIDPCVNLDINNKVVWNTFWNLMTKKMFMIPAFWDYPIWDDLMYDIMCKDEIRMNSYRKVIERKVKNKTVVEIGTGTTAPLAIMCANAGAKKVYTIEANEDAAEKATKLIYEKGLSDRIKVIVGNAMTIELPELVDVCLSEIIGCIGSSEGAIAILNDAKRFLKEDGTMIPERHITKIAPVFLPDNLYHDALIQYIVDYYTEAVYEKRGRKFPFTRFEFYNFPESHLIDKPQIFEDINFQETLEENFKTSASFQVSSDCSFDGFLLWINLYVDYLTMIDSFNGSVWGAIYMPVEKFSLKKGDNINVEHTVRLSENGINPDYIIKGFIKREKHDIHNFSIYSYY